MIDVGLQFVDAAAAAGDAEARALLTPAAQTEGAAGMDLVSAEDATLAPGARALLATGIAIELPNGTEGQVRPRSGLAVKHGVTVLNSPGTIDADYRGEIKVCLINHGGAPFVVTRGMRIAQLVVAHVAAARLVVREQLGETGRGQGGFGSTGTSTSA